MKKLSFLVLPRSVAFSWALRKPEFFRGRVCQVIPRAIRVRCHLVCLDSRYSSPALDRPFSTCSHAQAIRTRPTLRFMMSTENLFQQLLAIQLANFTPI